MTGIAGRGACHYDWNQCDVHPGYEQTSSRRHPYRRYVMQVGVCLRHILGWFVDQNLLKLRLFLLDNAY
jgi:hypothetical protein